MRLPEFLTKISPLGETLAAMEQGKTLLSAELERQYANLFLSGSEEGLSLWEQDYSLSSTGNTETRRARIRTALSGANTLTPEELKSLAILLGGADCSEVTELFSEYQVVLSALYNTEPPAEKLIALKEAVARRKPAHLEVLVQTTLPTKKVVYCGMITPRSVAAGASAGTSIGNYALFSGGGNGSAVYDSVDAYDSSLTKIAATPLFQQKNFHNGASNGRYAIFALGSFSSTDAYDESLTRSIPASAGRAYMPAAASIGPYALFGGGSSDSSWTTPSSEVIAYNNELTKTATSLSAARAYFGAASNGTHALFGGGFGKTSGPFYSTVDAYDETLTRTIPTALSVSRSHNTGAARAGNHAVFAGGYNGSSNITTADAYDSDLTRTLPAPLDSACHRNMAVSLGDFALFNCGAMGSTNINAYDASLIHSIPCAMTDARGDAVGIAVGDYALFGGGANADGICQTTVDAFTLV